MKRRLFLQSLSAFFAAPAMPVQAVAAISAPATAPPAGAVFWANYLAKAHPVCTQETMMRIMGVTEKTARAVHSHLVTQNVISPLGVVNPKMVSELVVNSPFKTPPEPASTLKTSPKKPALRTGSKVNKTNRSEISIEENEEKPEPIEDLSGEETLNSETSEISDACADSDNVDSDSANSDSANSEGANSEGANSEGADSKENSHEPT